MKTFKEYIKENTDSMLNDIEFPCAAFKEKFPYVNWYNLSRQDIKKKQYKHDGSLKDRTVFLGDIVIDPLPLKNLELFKKISNIHIEANKPTLKAFISEYLIDNSWSSPTIHIQCLRLNLVHQSANDPTTSSHRNFLYCPFRTMVHIYGLHDEDISGSKSQYYTVNKTEIDKIIKKINIDHECVSEYVNCINKGKEGYIEFFLDKVNKYIEFFASLRENDPGFRVHVNKYFRNTVLELLMRDNMIGEEDYNINYAIQNL